MDRSSFEKQQILHHLLLPEEQTSSFDDDAVDDESDETDDVDSVETVSFDDENGDDEKNWMEEGEEVQTYWMDMRMMLCNSSRHLPFHSSSCFLSIPDDCLFVVVNLLVDRDHRLSHSIHVADDVGKEDFINNEIVQRNKC